MPRAGLTAAAVVAAGAQMLDAQPGEGLNLATLAESLGVRPPSLYKHIDGIEGLRREIMLRAKTELADVLAEAGIGKAGEAAVRAVAVQYRTWAKAHPAQYAMTVRAPVPGDTDDEETSFRLVSILYRILEGYGIGGDDLVDAARFLRSSLHGFVDLETRGAFELPVEIERSFTRLVSSVTAALTSWSK